MVRCKMHPPEKNQNGYQDNIFQYGDQNFENSKLITDLKRVVFITRGAKVYPKSLSLAVFELTTFSISANIKDGG